MSEIARIIIIIYIMNCGLFADDIKILNNPIPNYWEKELSKLDLVKTIENRIDQKTYLFRPQSIAIDNQNNIFIFDSIQGKLIKLDSKYEVKAVIGKKGRGNNEFGAINDIMNINIKIGKNGDVIVQDGINKQFQIFSNDLTFKRVQLYPRSRTIFNWLPSNKNGDIYPISIDNNILNIIDDKGAIYQTIELSGENSTYLFIAPSSLMLDVTKEDVQLEWGIENELIAYFPFSSCLDIIRKDVFKKFHIFPKKAIDNYRNRIKELRNKLDFVKVGQQLIIDNDNRERLYIQFNEHINDKAIVKLYQFNKNGELGDIYTIEYVSIDDYIKKIVAKRNNLFYALWQDKITIYKKPEVDRRN